MATVSKPPLPTHNLFGDHGPRCPMCSGLGSVLRIPGDGGKPTRSASRCLCGGSGIDQEIVRAHERQSLLQRIETLEKALGIVPALTSQYKTSLKMSRQYWEELIAWSTSDGVAVANTTTEAIIFPDITVPANYMQDGRALRLYASGRYSTTATPNLIFMLRWGGVAGTILAQSAPIVGGSTITNAIWELELRVQTRLNGATGTLFVTGKVGLGSGLTTPAVGSATGSPGWSMMGAAASQITPAAVVSNLTADTALSLTADWSAASASNTLTGHNYQVESLN